MSETAPAPPPRGSPAASGPSARRVADIARMERLYGAPRAITLEVPMAPWEFDLLRFSKRDGRYRDATILIPHEGKLVCIVKHGYPPGVARPPSGGVVPGEPIDAAAEREAYEETGLRVRISRYLLFVACWFSVGERTAPPERALAEASRFRNEDDFFDEIARYAAAHPVTHGSREYWESHVFWAEPVGGTLEPRDKGEIKAIELLAPEALEREVHGLMRQSGIGGFDYRVRLQEAALAAARDERLL